MDQETKIVKIKEIIGSMSLRELMSFNSIGMVCIELSDRMGVPVSLEDYKAAFPDK